MPTTRPVDVTNDSPVNSAHVTWQDSRTSPKQSVDLAPGQAKSFPDIAGSTDVKVTIVSGPISVSVKDTGTGGLKATQTVITPIAAGATQTFSVAGVDDQIAIS